jgi:cupin 2 domain-containing protein
MSDGNLFAALAAKRDDEALETLLSAPGVSIERIISTGQVSADWYDQDRAEWVAVLSGAAALLFEDEMTPRELRAGDYVLITPHHRHRVTWTDPDRPTVWLAVHFGDPRAL